LLFAAVFSRALIPVGFMPGAGGIVLCSGYASVPAVDMPGMNMSAKTDQANASAPSHRHEAAEICLFSAVARLMAAGHPSALAAFPYFVPGTVFPPEKSIPRGTIVPTSLPRGPPATV
jgi:hypothetical protein